MITHQELKELIHYDPETGVFTWRHRPEARPQWNGKFAGKVAGNVNVTQPYGYKRVVIRIGKRLYKAHRLAWLYMTGVWPESDIDHGNHDGTDNRWENLKSCTRKANGRNQSKSRNNTSGVTGVVWHKKSGKWMARAEMDGKQKHLGLFHKDDLDLAAMEVMEYRALHGFNPSHGMDFAPYLDQ